MESTVVLFEYSRLGTPTSIRILALNPGIGEEQLSGALQHVDLQSTVLPFTALSYVWGPVTYDRTFSTQSGMIKVTGSLEEVLKRLRSSHETLYVWADGICINQQDIHERESQVKLMHRIYVQAHQVTIWLGPDSNETAPAAFDLLRQYSDVRTSLNIAKMQDPAMDWSPLAELAGLDYFKRVWVIQEGLLNNNGLVLWGACELSLSKISYALLRLMNISYFGNDYRQAFSWMSNLARDKSLSPGHNIFTVLQWVRTRHCLDDRDRFYAILGLQYSERYPWNVCVKNLEPDYSRLPADLYAQVAYEMLKRGGTLHLLNSVHNGADLQAWSENSAPSWLPKWHEYLTSDLEHEDLNDYWTVKDTQWHHRFIYPYSVDVDRKSMTVECIQYDAVTMFSGFLLHHDSDTKSAESIYAFWTGVMHRTKSLQINRLVLAWLAVRMSDALCGSVYSYLRTEAGLRGARNLIRVLDRQHLAQDVAESEKAANRQLRELTQSSLDVVEEQRDKLAPLEYVPRERIYHPTERLRGRRLFFTERNEIGLGPEAMREGDVVVNLMGSSLPFILRRQGAFYQFMGAARIHEEMRRDALSRAEKDGAVMEHIEIR